ncbi:hypothetical protein D3C80_2025010 [compost metagenome]
MGGIGLIFAHQLYNVLLVLFIDKSHPAANVHFIHSACLGDNLGALHAGGVVTQVAFSVGQTLFVSVFALSLQLVALCIQRVDPLL